MVKARSRPRVGRWLGLLILSTLPCAVRGAPPSATAAPAAEAMAPPPLVVGVAIDETGITPRDLERSHDLILALLGSLPRGSLMTMASFRGDQRILLPPTADPSQVTSALARFKPSQNGVALPDGLFDIVEYLSRQEAQARVLFLVSSGRVREGDLQFEDPLAAARAKGIPIFALALGQGDGRLLRRVAKITGGEYMRLEVADASMLTRAIEPRAGSTTNAANAENAATAATAVEEAGAGPTPSPAPGGSAGLLGAAAILFSLGGLLMLAIVVLLGWRLLTPAQAPARVAPPEAKPSTPPAPEPPTQDNLAPIDDDEAGLEKTLVVEALPTLRALSGPGAGKNFPLSPSGTTSIGRSRRNDILVPEDAASAQHCRIDREGDSYVLHDLGATNGTWVNGTRSDRTVLQHGDRLKVGETVFTVSLFGDRS